MVNLLPKGQRGKDEIIRVLGVVVGPIPSASEREVAYHLDQFLKDRPELKFTGEQIAKAYAYALTLCPAIYINPETLDWNCTEPPNEKIVLQAVSQAVRKVSVMEPRTKAPMPSARPRRPEIR